MKAQTILIIYLLVFTADFLWERFLTLLNMRFVRSHGKKPPEALSRHITLKLFSRSVDYTLERSRFGLISSTVTALFILLMILSGWLGQLDRLIQALPIISSLKSILYIYLISLIFSLISLPFSLHSQFIIEERYGFNRMTLKLFFIDLLKSLVISLILFTPLLFVLFWFMEETGTWWWLWAFGLIAIFQIVVIFIYPTLIAPLFNKFLPLKEGSLKERIIGLTEAENFPIKGVYVVDGSKRSGHSNAYFTGFGRSKRIVLFDTLMEKLKEKQITAVLAHEIGHQKKHHVLIHLIISMISLLIGLWLISLLLTYDPFFTAFGFAAAGNHSALVLFLFFSSPFTFLLKPLFSAWSRSHEYAADRFAARAMDESESLQGALINMSRDNLSNLTPHPLYSFYHYSHPALVERLAALRKL